MKIESMYSEDFVITQDEVNAFSEITGDKNPIHIDADYASKTVFKKPIIHGFFAGSKISKVFGMSFPGEGTIYLSQDMKFLKPMFVENVYTVEFKVMETNIERMRLTIETRIFEKSTGINVIIGKALVQNPNLKFEL